MRYWLYVAQTCFGFYSLLSFCNLMVDVKNAATHTKDQ